MKQQTKTILAGIGAGIVFLLLFGWIGVLVYTSGGLAALIILIVVTVVLVFGSICLTYFLDNI